MHMGIFRQQQPVVCEKVCEKVCVCVCEKVREKKKKILGRFWKVLVCTVVPDALLALVSPGDVTTIYSCSKKTTVIVARQAVSRIVSQSVGHQQR
jgi:hypothetical protein